MPRMLRSTGTPACDARYSARMQRRSTSAFIFIRSARAPSVGGDRPLDLVEDPVAQVVGATSTLR